jgi:NADPH-dependent stearoyl-CoA 9-desaturase
MQNVLIDDQNQRSAPPRSSAGRQPSLVTQPAPLAFASDEQRLASFGRALDALRREVEDQLGEVDAQHIKRVGAASRRLALLGRGLLFVSVEPVGFGLGTAALWAHKALELMEIGHPALHGCYDGLPGAERFYSGGFVWKSPIDEDSWRQHHNVKHHQYTNIEGLDPDLDFGALRLSPRVPYRLAHALQPLSNLLTLFGFGAALNLQATGMLDIYLQPGAPVVLPDKRPATLRKAHRVFFSKLLRHYGKEYVVYPLLAGPFFAKVLLGNLLSEVARDLHAGLIIYCGHVGASDYPRSAKPASRAEWYAMQVEGSRDVELPELVSVLCGALDKQIEHHLFPRLPPNRLREIAPRVRAICEAHGVNYRSDSWPRTLRSVFRELRRLGSARASADSQWAASAAYAAAE